MGRVPLVVIAVGVALALSLPVSVAAETKVVRGTVSAVAGDTVTVTAQGKAMAFKVDDATEIVGPGLGTKTRQAKAAGLKGVKLDEIFKAGDVVEVHYTMTGTTMKAVEMRTGVPLEEPAAAKAPEVKSARGVVTAVAANSITVKGDGGEWTFMVDAKARVVGHGLGTLAREKAEASTPTTLADTVKVNDRVVVNYHDMHGKLHATMIRVLEKN